jgi:hypothetical protein
MKDRSPSSHTICEGGPQLVEKNDELGEHAGGITAEVNDDAAGRTYLHHRVKIAMDNPLADSLYGCRLHLSLQESTRADCPEN